MADKMEGVTGGGHAVDPSNYPVPIETIWVGNLEERVKIPTLKAALTVVFKRFGPIVDIIAKTSLKRKGQAFVVFDSEKSALESVELMDGFPMYGKEMKVQRAKTHSDATVKSKAADMFDDHKRKRLMQKDFKRAKEDAEAAANPAAAEKPRTLKSAISVIPDEYVRPNKVLFLQNLPDDIDEDNLTTIFERFEGFKEIRYLSVRAVGFAEFENEQYAITAKEATANMPVGAGKRPMKVSYQRELREGDAAQEEGLTPQAQYIKSVAQEHYQRVVRPHFWQHIYPTFVPHLTQTARTAYHPSAPWVRDGDVEDATVDMPQQPMVPQDKYQPEH